MSLNRPWTDDEARRAMAAFEAHQDVPAVAAQLAPILGRTIQGVEGYLRKLLRRAGITPPKISHARKMAKLATYKPPSGESHHASKLDWAKVRLIRESALPASHWANLYGVSEAVIRSVRKFKSWRNPPPSLPPFRYVSPPRIVREEPPAPPIAPIMSDCYRHMNIVADSAWAAAIPLPSGG